MPNELPRSENLPKATETATAATAKATNLGEMQVQLTNMDVQLKNKSKEIDGLRATIKNQGERIIVLSNDKHTLQNKVFKRGYVCRGDGMRQLATEEHATPSHSPPFSH